MFVLWIKKKGKARAKAEGIAKGVCVCHAESAIEIRINETETNLQKEVEKFFDRYDVSRSEPGNKMALRYCLSTFKDAAYKI